MSATTVVGFPPRRLTCEINWMIEPHVVLKKKTGPPPRERLIYPRLFGILLPFKIGPREMPPSTLKETWTQRENSSEAKRRRSKRWFLCVDPPQNERRRKVDRRTDDVPPCRSLTVSSCVSAKNGARRKCGRVSFRLFRIICHIFHSNRKTPRVKRAVVKILGYIRVKESIPSCKRVEKSSKNYNVSSRARDFCRKDWHHSDFPIEIMDRVIIVFKIQKVTSYRCYYTELRPSHRFHRVAYGTSQDDLIHPLPSR